MTDPGLPSGTEAAPPADPASPPADSVSPPGDLTPSSTESSRPRRRFWWIGASAAVMVLLIAAIVVAGLRGGRVVRYEVTTTSGTAAMITWTDGTEMGGLARGDDLDSTIPTPWSATVRFKASTGLIAVAVSSLAEGDTATCRISAGGRVIATATGPRETLCESTLEAAFPG